MKFSEAQGLNRNARRQLAKQNGIKKIPGNTKPYTKPKKAPLSGNRYRKDMVQ